MNIIPLNHIDLDLTLKFILVVTPISFVLSRFYSLFSGFIRIFSLET